MIRCGGMTEAQLQQGICELRRQIPAAQATLAAYTAELKRMRRARKAPK